VLAAVRWEAAQAGAAAGGGGGDDGDDIPARWAVQPPAVLH
jgi:hypothetical protein